MSKIKPAIEIKGLSKAYMIGHEREAMAGTMTFRDSLTNLARKPIELITGHQLKKEKFWALRDVNLKIERGDVVGIIGRNGSGKSTLLKVLSRIVEPTKGEVIMRGRVASLLEVGTGFHPELTGRENVYFNGAILGMTRKEIQSKFDEIVAFSEVEKFLDTPVKFYSSGMYVRLAFAVAAHLDPDILIVDEVLAVGDAAFQKKCLGKMRDVAGQGRTVLFVSHSMQSVQALCNKGVVMSSGKLVNSGSISAAIAEYYNVNHDDVLQDIQMENFAFKKFTLNSKKNIHLTIEGGEGLKLSFVPMGDLDHVDIGLGLRDVASGIRIAFLDTITANLNLELNAMKRKTILIRCPDLSPGEYDLEMHIWNHKNIKLADKRISRITVAPYDMYKSGNIISSMDTIMPLVIQEDKDSVVKK